MAGGLLMYARRTTSTSHRRDERGAVAVLAALLSAGLFLTAALVIDLGLARDTKRVSQNASDASALAAANALYPDSGSCVSVLDLSPPCYRDAVDAAKAYAATNFDTTNAQWNACNDPNNYWVVPLTTDCVSFTDNAEGASKPGSPTKVRVVMPMRDVDVVFGASTDIETVEIGTTARASVDAGTWEQCGLCFLGPVDSINADFTVTGGDIHVNGDLDSGPNGVWTADSDIGVVGTVSGGQFNPGYTSAPPITDPWASRSDLPPSLVGLPQKTNPCGASGGSGIYGSLQLSPNQTCNMQPGLYVVVGTWSQKNNSAYVGSGVTLYFTCGTKPVPTPCLPGQAGGMLDAKNGDLSLSAPTVEPTDGVVDVAIMYDRQNINSIDLQGNGTTGITGAVYAPSSKLDFNGNSCFGFSGGPVIVDGVNVANGNQSCVNVTDPNNTDIYELPGEIALDK